MMNNNLLKNLQHGFVPGKSCQSNLLSMFNIKQKLFLSADDTKFLRVSFSAGCHQELQSDIEHLTEWSDKW